MNNTAQTLDEEQDTEGKPGNTPDPSVNGLKVQDMDNGQAEEHHPRRKCFEYAPL